MNHFLGKYFYVVHNSPGFKLLIFTIRQNIQRLTLRVHSLQSQSSSTPPEHQLVFPCTVSSTPENLPDHQSLDGFESTFRQQKRLRQRRCLRVSTNPSSASNRTGVCSEKWETSDIIQKKQSGYVSLHTHFAYFFRFMAANLSFTQFVT